MLFLTLYLTGPRDLSVAAAGLVVGGFFSGQVCCSAASPGGKWGDHFGHRPGAAARLDDRRASAPIAVPWAADVERWRRHCPYLAYVERDGQGVSTGALAALAVKTAATGVRRASPSAGQRRTPGSSSGRLSGRSSSPKAQTIRAGPRSSSSEGLMILGVRLLVAPPSRREQRHRVARHADGSLGARPRAAAPRSGRTGRG